MRDADETQGLPIGGLAAALRAVRKHRGLLQTEVASGLGISRRTYLDLEAGIGRMTVEQLVAFADLTNSDRFALVAAALFERPSLAVRYADNKLMTVLAFAGDDFEAAIGGAASDVRPRELMRLLEEAFTRLATDVKQRQIDRAELTAGDEKTSPDEEGGQP